MYVPNLLKNNHIYYGEKFHYNGKDIYCSIIKYSTFISNAKSYINGVFNKRDDDSFEIKKITDKETPRIGKR